MPTVLEYRQREYDQAKREEQHIGSLLCDYRTVGGCKIQIDREAGDALAKLKTEALLEAIRKVQAQRFELPRGMRFVLSVHELGHVLHEKDGGQKFWDRHDDVTMDRGLQAAALKVSHYATKSPLEFVAEVFAGRVHGKMYGKEVVEEYRKLGGPETRGFF